MDDDQLSRFLGNFETKVYFEENKESFPGRRVFWSQNLQQNSNEIHGKVKSAFSSIDVPRLKGLIQFWAPLATTEGRHLLSTSDQPFVLEDLDPRLCKYRLHSVRYQYSIDDHMNDNDNTSIISNGFVATAFHNRFPEVLLDLRQMISIEDGRSTKDPLVYSALNCDLTSSILFPIFYHSSSCVGVVECCMKRVGLTTYPIQEGLPDMVSHWAMYEMPGAATLISYTIRSVLACYLHTMNPTKVSCMQPTMDSFKRVRDEIEDALKFVCESHHLALGQVWIPYYDDYVSFTSSSLEDPHHTKPMFALRLSGYCCIDSDDDPIKDYYDTSSILPLKLEEGLPGKTLATHQPHFCINLCKPRRVSGFLGIYSGSAKCSCLAICLRSVHTADLDYAFEFFWLRSRNYLIVLESLLSKLKMCLPSFKFPSGAEVGEELCILDVENSTRNRSGSFKIFKGGRLSKTLGASKETRSVADEARQQYESTLVESERDANDQWLRAKHVKRELYDMSDGEGEADIDPFWEDDDDMLMETYYRNEFTLIYLRSSYTLANVKKIIEEDFKLDPGTYVLGYLFEKGSWVKLDTDERLSKWKKHSRSAQKSCFTVCVVPLDTCGCSGQQAQLLSSVFCSGEECFILPKVSD